MEEENLETSQELNIDTWTNNITDNQFISYGLKIGAGIIVFILFVVISKIITKIIKKNIKKHLEETNPTGAAKIAKLLGSILFWVLMLFALFISFEIMGINIGLLVSGVSLGVGLAFKEVLGNMFAGIMILYTKEFKMGDIIEIQAGEGYFGRIEEITIRYTVIRTLDLRQVIIPNMTMISEPIKTFSSEDMVKLNTIIGISYNSDLTKAIDVLKDTINTFDFVKSKENTTVYVLEFGASTIDLKCIFCFDPNCGIIGEVAIGHINEKITQAFKTNGIAFSYPHITVNFENQPNNDKYNEFIKNEEGEINITNTEEDTNETSEETTEFIPQSEPETIPEDPIEIEAEIETENRNETNNPINSPENQNNNNINNYNEENTDNNPIEIPQVASPEFTPKYNQEATPDNKNTVAPEQNQNNYNNNNENYYGNLR